MSEIVNLRDAKTRLANLIDQAAKGEEIVIAKNGVPLAKLIALPPHGRKRRPAKAIGITYIADDFDEPCTATDDLFAGGD